MVVTLASIPWPSLAVVAGLIAALIGVTFAAGAANLRPIPGRFQNVLEAIAEGMRAFTVNVIGPHGTKYAPLVGTLFVYILTMNLLSLLPPMLGNLGIAPPTVRFDTTLALGVATYVFVLIVAIKENGLTGFLKHLANWIPTKNWGFALIQLVLLSPLMFFLHTISEGVRPVTLGFRLFMNMFGKEELVQGMMNQGVFGYAIYTVVLIPLALIVSIVQTTIFTMLTCVYLSIWTTHEEEHAEEGHEPAH